MSEQTPIENATAEGKGILRKLGFRGILSILLGILIIVFIFENTGHARIRFIAGSKVSAPLGLALFLAGVVGVIVGRLFSWRRNRK